MKTRIKLQVIAAWLMAGAIAQLCVSCIREEKPNINVDITDLQPKLQADGIVSTTIQENGVTVYADASADLTNMPLAVYVSEGATYEYVDVDFNVTVIPQIEIGGVTLYNYEVVDTVVTEHKGEYTDFSKTRYIKVTAEAEGLSEDDKATPASFNKFGGMDANNHLYKIWSIQVLPAGFPTELTFDNWYHPYGRGYWHPYEIVDGIQDNIWSSTNNSLAIMVSVNPRDLRYGAAPTEDTATGEGKALVLTTNDIHLFDKNKPFVAGCCFIGEFDGTDNDALTCTHVGMPFNKKPKALRFWYKYQPKHLAGVDSNPLDQGFIKAVLYRTDDDVKYLTGKTIRDDEFANTVAYAEFDPDEVVDTYQQKEITFKYVQEVSTGDLNHWKYNLAIYFASSKNGFIFEGGPGTQLFIDNMEVVCDE